MASPRREQLDDEPLGSDGRAALDECVLDWLGTLRPTHTTFGYLFAALSPYSTSISGALRDRIAVYLENDAESRREVRASLKRLRAAGLVARQGRRYALTREGERHLRGLWASRPGQTCGRTTCGSEVSPKQIKRLDARGGFIGADGKLNMSGRIE
jgi:hypothetical protein